MKKTTLLLVAILVSVALSVTGCGGGGGSDDVAIVDTGNPGGGTGGDTGGTGGDTGGTGGDTGGTGGDTGGTGGTGGDTGGTGGDTGGTSGTGGTGGTGGGTGGGDDEPTVADTDFNPVVLVGLGGNFSAGVAINIDGLAVGLSDNGSSVKGAKWLVTDASPTAIELSPLDGNNYSAAYGVNDFGVAVGESGAIGSEPDAIADANTVAVYWPSGDTLPSALSTEGLFAGGASAAFAINENGEIVGEAVNDDLGNTVAVYWASTSADPLVLNNLSGGSFSSAYFISSVGDVVGEAQNAQGQAQAAVWVPSAGGGYEAPSSLNPVANNQIRSAAFGIDFNGSIVGEAELVSGLQGVIWNTDGSVDSTLGEDTSAQAINDVDRVVGYTAALSDSDHAAIWNAASIADFRNLASIFSQAYALNDNNEIVGMVGNQAFAAIPVSQ